MPATYEMRQLASGYTQATVNAFMNELMRGALQREPIDSWTDGSSVIRTVYPMPAGIVGKALECVCVVQVSSTSVVTLFHYTSFNPVNRAFGAFTNVSSISFNTPAVPVDGGFGHLTGEANLLHIKVGTQRMLFGVLQPFSRPAWWDVTLWSWYYPLSGSDMLAASMYNGSLNPWGDTTTIGRSLEVYNGVNLTRQDTRSNEQEIVSRLNYSSRYSYLGHTSDDLGITNGGAPQMFDTLTRAGTTEEWVVLDDRTVPSVLRIR